MTFHTEVPQSELRRQATCILENMLKTCVLPSRLFWRVFLRLRLIIHHILLRTKPMLTERDTFLTGYLLKNIYQQKKKTFILKKYRDLNFPKKKVLLKHRIL